VEATYSVLAQTIWRGQDGQVARWLMEIMATRSYLKESGFEYHLALEI